LRGEHRPEEEILNPNQNGVIYNFVDEEARDDSCRRSGCRLFFLSFFFLAVLPSDPFLRDGVEQDNGGWRLRGGMACFIVDEGSRRGRGG
jgi:hypothetical protein